jgi:putative transposase
MARPPRTTPGGFVYHVCNRGARKGPLFTSDEEYTAFEGLLAEGRQRRPMRITAYCLMGNHWHLLLWPVGDRDLSCFLHWVETKHANWYRRQTDTVGEGAVYQSRFNARPITSLVDYLCVCRYVERNPLEAHLVERAEQWRWSSAAQRASAEAALPMDDGPIPLPTTWLEIVNQPMDLAAEEFVAQL